jgi:hypothetical protein
LSIDGEAWRVLAPQKYELFPFRKHFEENPRKTNKKVAELSATLLILRSVPVSCS